MNQARLRICTIDCSSSLEKNTLAIQLDNNSPYRAIVEDNAIRLYAGNTLQLEVQSDGSINPLNAIQLVPDISESQKYLTLQIVLSGQKIGKLYYSMDPSQSILPVVDIFTSLPNTPSIDMNL